MSDAVDSEKKADGFRRLKELAAPGFENRFQTSSNYVERGEDYSLCVDGEEDAIRFTVQGDYLKKLKEWEDAAPPGERRAQVANNLQDAHLTKALTLMLEDRTITSLPPELPATLRVLELVSCSALTSLPEQWPGLLQALRIEDCDALVSLPEQLPLSLRLLRIKDCPAIRELPEQWPGQLSHLDLWYCPSLTSLPEQWPGSLIALDIAHCDALALLPAQWPDSLHDFNLLNCPSLTLLPAQWPGSLQSLRIVHCDALTLLPARWPDSLRQLTIRDCAVLGGLPERAPASLSATIVNCPYLVVPDELRLPVQDWWCIRAGVSQERLELLRRSWEAVENEDDYPSFQTLLERLSAEPLVDYVNPSDIVEVIEEVIESSAARAQILEQSQSAAQNCEDRPLTIFNTVQSIARFSRLQREQAPVAELLGLAEGMLKTALLDEATIPVMRKQWEEGRRTGNGSQENPGPNVFEALEVQLELRRALGSDLGLPFRANSLYSQEISGLNEHDREFAKQFVQDRMADMAGRISGLISIPMWECYVKQQCQAELEAIYDKYWNLLERLEDEKERLNSQEYDEGYRQLKAAREAEINGVLFMRTRAIATGQPVLTF
jgi:hypothetical protein